MDSVDPEEITVLINRWQQIGDSDALNQVLPLIERYLRSIAHHLMAKEQPRHLFTTRDLIQEALLKLDKSPMKKKFSDRKHFLRIAARVMRSVLITHANAEKTDKRGGKIWRRCELELDWIGAEPEQFFFDLDSTLNQLHRWHPQAADLFTYRYFLGLTIDEISEFTDVPTATVKRRVKLAKDWLKGFLSPLSCSKRSDPKI